ncbi:sugar transferase [Rhizobium sullae]|uniref:Exopolysaccharide biosynthesis polyprenyl glycosylphosphotransferase n=1 Tax=Rhizobium sullae TaxID=50338 RepID=A0A4R3PZW1_RHISU|nr:sugar transferase [Rhizobium sullae]TCU06830.1 exopolysaccharide biosynthesis polyprenyl glycosylphosphotransferase [Rhizobium sullae]
MNTLKSSQLLRWKSPTKNHNTPVDFQTVSKRCVDLTISVALLAVLSPLLLALAFLVRLTSSGPAIYKQQRRGLGGKSFECYKFRTMRVSRDSDVFIQCTRNDSRITGIGRILRRTSLDELPQLFNVLFGTMSLVGPRPHPLKLDDEYSTRIPGYEQRFLVKPGITGLAQIKGHRGPTETLKDMQRRIAADQTYVRNRSLKLDIDILLATVPSVLKGTNAF